VDSTRFDWIWLGFHFISFGLISGLKGCKLGLGILFTENISFWERNVSTVHIHRISFRERNMSSVCTHKMSFWEGNSVSVHTVLIFPSRKEILWVCTLLTFLSQRKILWVHTAHISFLPRIFLILCSHSMLLTLSTIVLSHPIPSYIPASFLARSPSYSLCCCYSLV